MLGEHSYSARLEIVGQRDSKHRCKMNKIEKVHHWFGDSSSEESSGESNTEEDNWDTVDRKRKNNEKKRTTKERRDRKTAEVAMKAKRMAGVGPITYQEIDDQNKVNNNYELAKVYAVKAHLAEKYRYNQKELDELNILETKRTNKDNIIYIAVNNERDIRYIYSRKVECYISPQCFNTLNKVCAQWTSKNKSLKIQIIFGDRDLLVLTKEKVGENPFRIVDLKDFLGEQLLPDFDMTLKWRVQ